MLILDERLSLCASYVRESTALADVGTDHAYLPVWLSLNKRIRSAVASDVRKGPLGNAEKNIKFYGVGDIVKTVLSDGLDSVSPDEADDIVENAVGLDVLGTCSCGTSHHQGNYSQYGEKSPHSILDNKHA